MVDVPDHQQGRYVRYRLEYRMHQQNIDQGRVVDDERVAVEGVPAIPPQPPDGLGRTVARAVPEKELWSGLRLCFRAGSRCRRFCPD